MNSDETIAEEVVAIHEFMNEQYRSFRELWVTFDLYAVSMGLWVCALLTIELLLPLTMYSIYENKVRRSLLLLGVRIGLVTLPFIYLHDFITDLTKANLYIFLLIVLTYVKEFSLYNGYLLGKAFSYVFVDRKSQL